MNQPTESASTVEVQGEFWPFSIVQHWIMLAPIRDKACRLFQIFIAHINQQRGDTDVWPSREVLASMLSLETAKSVDPYIRELEDAGMITVKRGRADNGMRARNIYTIRLTPPPGMTVARSIYDYYKSFGKSPAQHVVPNSGLREPTIDETAGGDVVPNSSLRSPELGTSVVPTRGLELEEPKQEEIKDPPLRSNGSVGSGTAAVTDEEEIPEDETPKPPPPPAEDVGPIADPTVLMPVIADADIPPEPHNDSQEQDQEADVSQAIAVVEALDWGSWGNPTREQLATLYGPIQQALDLGYAPRAVAKYANDAIARADINPGPYLLRALTPRSEGGWLRPPPEPATLAHSFGPPHTMSPSSEWRHLPDIDDNTRENAVAQVRKALAQRKRPSPIPHEGVPV